jgi:hypothetical protein
METRIPKQAIFEACIKRQEELIANFSGEFDEMNEDLRDQDTIASQADHNEAAEQADMRSAMNRELEFLHFEMKMLNDLDLEKEYRSVEPGAVVVTDQRVFFISVSIEEVSVGDHKVFGLSTEAPIYAQMRGKVKGDSFTMNQHTYRILDLY